VPAKAEEFRRKIRIACQAFNMHRFLWPRLKRRPALDVYKYVSHKLVRWLAILWLALAVLFFEAGMAAAGHMFTGFALLLLGLLALWTGLEFGARPIPRLVDILIAFTGTGIGVWRSLRGERFATWRPALSIRGQRTQAP
jgi:hypothetical protein